MLHKKIKFSKKSLADLKADVLFSYTSTDLIWSGPGIASTMLELDKSGEVERECGAVGAIKVGSAVMLKAGDLPYDQVCHLAIAGLGKDCTEMSVSGSLRWAFSLCTEQRVKTIVLPTLFHEGLGMPVGLCADIVLREALVHVNADPYIEQLTIFAQSQEEYREYQKRVKEMKKK